ncbi:MULTISPECIES: hypothetical protein [Protofrankia]|uniref:Uncharacterized protein n=1 Tax=Protofrankia coriariae TaxID=1562887 RepID=A0ABR5EZI9_9ACTN|nr:MULTISPECIES: hypothetical protein [Protofrankia]KLL09880.1 hypothetical protein FrCorBMG51_21865 [Protofrankia coriariae]ONH34204.1 hypothetical protein BL254_17585 [Protofrankia sp. BMG5.30]
MLGVLADPVVRIGVYIDDDHDYYLSPAGDLDVIVEERAHFVAGTWAAYQLTTVVQCPHCDRRYATDVLGGVVVETTALAGSIVWADDVFLRENPAGYLALQIRDLIAAEREDPSPATAWWPLPGEVP